MSAPSRRRRARKRKRLARRDRERRARYLAADAAARLVPEVDMRFTAIDDGFTVAAARIRKQLALAEAYERGMISWLPPVP